MYLSVVLETQKGIPQKLRTIQSFLKLSLLSVVTWPLEDGAVSSKGTWQPFPLALKTKVLYTGRILVSKFENINGKLGEH